MAGLAFLFAGQGAQAVGMARSLYEGDAAARAVLDAAERLRPGLLNLMFEGPKVLLDATENTQPCVFAADVAAYAAISAKGVTPRAVAGFSLGEYAALNAAGALPFEEMFRLVERRARFMAKAPAGGMAAVLGVDAARVNELISGMDGVEAVNYNCPGQTVIAGAAGALDAAEHALGEGGARVVRLPVSGAFHSSLMTAAAEQLNTFIQTLSFCSTAVPVYSNQTARPYEDVRGALAAQTRSPVLWERTIRNMLADGMDAFVELGPGNTLAGFMKRIDRKVIIYNVYDMDSLGVALEGLSGKGESA